MSFQQCENCQEKVRYKTKLKSVFFGYRPITCQSCGTVHEVDERFRFLFSMYTVMMPIILVYAFSAMLEIESRLFQVLLVLFFGILGVLYTTRKIVYRKAKHQPIKEE